MVKVGWGWLLLPDGIRWSRWVIRWARTQEEQGNVPELWKLAGSDETKLPLATCYESVADFQTHGPWTICLSSSLCLFHFYFIFSTGILELQTRSLRFKLRIGFMLWMSQRLYLWVYPFHPSSSSRSAVSQREDFSWFIRLFGFKDEVD